MKKTKEDEQFLKEVSEAVKSIFEDAAKENKVTEKLPIYILTYYVKKHKMYVSMATDVMDEAFILQIGLDLELVEDMTNTLVRAGNAGMENAIGNWIRYLFPDIQMSVELHTKKTLMINLPPDKFDCLLQVEEKPAIIRQSGQGQWEMLEPINWME